MWNAKWDGEKILSGSQQVLPWSGTPREQDETLSWGPSQCQTGASQYPQVGRGSWDIPTLILNQRPADNDVSVAAQALAAIGNQPAFPLLVELPAHRG